MTIVYRNSYFKNKIDHDVAAWLLMNNLYDIDRDSSMFKNVYDSASRELVAADGCAISLTIATDNDIPIGLCLCRHYYFRGETLNFNGAVGVYVKPEYRGQKIGEKLIDEWVQYTSPTCDENDVFIASEYCYGRIKNNNGITVMEFTKERGMMDVIEEILGIA